MSRLLHCHIRRWSLVALLMMLAAMFAPAGPAAPAQAAPVARPAPQAGGSLEFLRDNPDLQGLIEDADAWAVGGGYLYWAKCSSGPALAGIAPAAVGYLRRWPLRGGRAATLSEGATCVSNSMAADNTGLYYHDSALGAIMFRSASDPLTPRTVAASQPPFGPIVLDNGDTAGDNYMFWLENGFIRSVSKNDFSIAGRLISAGVNARSLMIDGANVLWFGNGRLNSMLKFCLAPGAVCPIQIIANETGDYLTNAIKQGPLLGESSHPLWVSGSSIRGNWCRPGRPPGPITVCSISSSYTAPTVNGNAYVPGRMDGDGSYLFWVESNMACGVFGCSPNSEGRLMKWNLKQSIFGTNPFDTPQAIACHDCGASYTLSRNEQLAVADGWVYFDSSNGISRVRADAPPIPSDLSVNGWEVTQGIQSPFNDVQLIANKPTYVRLFGNKLSGPGALDVDARLYGTTDTGVVLPGSPLKPINGTQSFIANNTPANRANPNGGWIFQLPDNWVNAGTIKLTPVIDPRQVWYDTNRGNNTLAAQSFTFIRKAPICIVFIPVRTSPPVQMFTPPHWFAIDMIRRVLPTPDVWVYHQDDDVAELEVKWGGPFNAIPYPGYGPYEMEDDSWKVLLSLWTRDQLSDDPDRCDNARARTHYVGVVNPNVDGNNGSGRVDGDQLWFRLPPDDLSRDWMTDRAVTLPHELGHNYGRRHVDCPPGDPDDTAFYPYPSCQLDQDDGINRHYGFTYNPTRGGFETILPTSAGDLMSYSHRRNPPLPRWISDFTWGGIQNEIPNGAAAQATQAETADAQHAPNLAAASSVVLISGAVDTAAPAQSALEHAWVFPSGAVSQRMLRKWQRTAAPAVASTGASAPAAGAYHLRLIGAGGAVLDDRAITLQGDADDSGPVRTFLLTFPAPAAPVARIELADGATVLTKLQPGANPPTVSIISPASGGTFDSKMTVSWRASDPDRSDLLLYTVQYSPDNGSTWRTVLANFPNLSGTDTATVDLKSLSGLPASTTGGLIRVLASDGYHTAMAVSKPFTVPNRAPQPAIMTPWPGQSIPAGQMVVLQGTASDAEDGGLSGASLRWTLDGNPIGTGQQQTIAGLAPGKYTVALTARDSAGREQTASTALTIEALRIPLGSAPTLDGECSDDAYAGATRVQIAPYADGSQPSAQLLRTASDLWVCFSNMARAGGTSPGSLAAIRIDANYSRDTEIQPGDYVLVLGEDGVLATYDGYSTPGPGGISVRVSANDSTWQAEYQIPAGVLGGWNHVVGMDVEHAWVNAVADDYFWPYSAAWNNPSSWAATALGDLPELTALAPASAPAGSAGFTLTVQGTNFATGATVRWNGAILPTTVVSSTQVRANVSAANLASAGTVAVTVANPGLSAAPSNALPFFISSSAPAAGGPRRLFLPLVRR